MLYLQPHPLCLLNVAALGCINLTDLHINRDLHHTLRVINLHTCSACCMLCLLVGLKLPQETDNMLIQSQSNGRPLRCYMRCVITGEAFSSPVVEPLGAVYLGCRDDRLYKLSLQQY